MAKAKPRTLDEQIADARAEIEAEHAKWRAMNDEFRARIEAMNQRLIGLEMQPRAPVAGAASSATPEEHGA